MVMDFMTAKETAMLWGISDRRVQELCATGRILGAQRLGGKMWMIPKGTPKPIDGRTRKGRLESSNYEKSN